MPIDVPLSFESSAGSKPGTMVFHVSGPMTMHNVSELQMELRSGDLAELTILDLRGVPYMDSTGMAMVVNFYVHCKSQKAGVVVAGASHRVQELFRITKLDTVIPLAADVEAAEALS